MELVIRVGPGNAAPKLNNNGNLPGLMSVNREYGNAVYRHMSSVDVLRVENLCPRQHSRGREAAVKLKFQFFTI